MPRSKKGKLEVRRGGRRDTVPQIGFDIPCTDAEGIGQLLSRYLIPILFEESEYPELNDQPLEEVENRVFRNHLRGCVSCAATVSNMKNLVHAVKIEEKAREVRKAEIKARLKLLGSSK